VLAPVTPYQIKHSDSVECLCCPATCSKYFDEEEEWQSCEQCDERFCHRHVDAFPRCVNGCTSDPVCAKCSDVCKCEACDEVRYWVLAVSCSLAAQDMFAPWSPPESLLTVLLPDAEVGNVLLANAAFACQSPCLQAYCEECVDADNCCGCWETDCYETDGEDNESD
jgi:hypothetical protein